MSDNPLTEWRIVLYAPAHSELGHALWHRLGIEAGIQPDRRIAPRRLSRHRGAPAGERRLTHERRGRYPYQFSGRMLPRSPAVI